MTRWSPSATPRHPSEFACIDFINTRFTDPVRPGVEIDRLPRRAWWTWFRERHGLAVGALHAVPIRRLADFRRHMRRLVEGWAKTGTLSARDVATLDRYVRKQRLRHRVQRRPTLELTIEPVTPGWDWVVGAIAASAVDMMLRHAHARLKVCANETCTWMFYDQTLNTSKRFCSTDLCGNVVRVRRFRSNRS